MTPPLPSRLRAAIKVLREDPVILFNSYSINGKVHRPDIAKELARYDDAIAAVSEAVRVLGIERKDGT